MLKRRTEAEIRAYAEGYSTCFGEFVKAINSNKSLSAAINKMYMLMTEVNNAIPKEGENNDGR